MNSNSIAQKQNVETARYQDGALSMDLFIRDDAVWMSQKQIADLLGLSIQNVNVGIRNGIDKGLIKDKAIMNFMIATSGGNKPVAHYSIDVVVYVAYRANPKEGTNLDKIVAFREWVAETLDHRIVKSIRRTEQAQYSDVKDFIVQASDYDANNPDCRNYFATIQNKLLYAASGMTAAEIIVKRADGLHPHMGLSAWQGESITKADAKVAKNYLTQDELQDLAALVIGLAAGAHMLMVKQSSTMRQWVTFVDQQIILYRCKLLMNKGLYSHEQAMKIVDREYQVFKGLLK